MDKKVCDKSTRKAPVRLFLMLIEMFSEFESEHMTYEEFEELMEDDFFKNSLLQKLEDKAGCYEESMELLGGMLRNWQTFWHFIWLKDDFRNVKYVGALVKLLEAKLKSAFDDLVAKCREHDAILTDGFRCTFGPNWTDFAGGRFNFSERMLLIDLSCGLSEAGEDDAPLLGELFDNLFDQHELQVSLTDLSEMGVIELRENFVSRGPNFEVDNDPWLTYQFLDDLVADAADAAPARVDQCDSCKRRPFESQDES